MYPVVVEQHSLSCAQHHSTMFLSRVATCSLRLDVCASIQRQNSFDVDHDVESRESDIRICKLLL